MVAVIIWTQWKSDVSVSMDTNNLLRDSKDIKEQVRTQTKKKRRLGGTIQCAMGDDDVSTFVTLDLT